MRGDGTGVNKTQGDTFEAGETVLAEKQEGAWVRAEYLSFDKTYGHIVRLMKPEIRFVLTLSDGHIRKLRS